MMNLRTFTNKASLKIRPFNGGKEKALRVSILDNLQIKTFALKSKPRFPFPHQILFVSQKLLLSLPPKINVGFGMSDFGSTYTKIPNLKSQN